MADFCSHNPNVNVEEEYHGIFFQLSFLETYRSQSIVVNQMMMKVKKSSVPLSQGSKYAPICIFRFFFSDCESGQEEFSAPTHDEEVAIPNIQEGITIQIGFVEIRKSPKVTSEMIIKKSSMFQYTLQHYLVLISS